jgi:hypothetical protein
MTIAEDQAMGWLERLVELVWLEEGMWQQEREGADEEGEEECWGEHGVVETG